MMISTAIKANPSAGHGLNRPLTLALLGFLLLGAWAASAGAAEAPEKSAVPGEAALWAAAGQAFADGQDKSAAMQQYRLFVQTYGKSPRSAGAQFMLGECYFAAGDFTGALGEYEQVSGRKGADEYLKASVLLRQGECYYNLGQFDEAIGRYDRLIEKYDDTFLLSEGLYEIGLTYIVEGNWLKLRDVYRELLERRPGYGEKPQVKFALGLFAYQEERYDEAIAYFSEVPSDRGLYYLGRCLEDTGQYILAIQRYRQVLRKYPDSPLADDVAFSVADAFYRSGQNSVAVRSYRAFLEQYPDSRFVPNARYKMACVTFNEGRFDESVRQLEEIVAMFPDQEISGYAQYLIGDCYMELGRSAEAIFAWTDVIRRFDQSRVASAALHKVVFTYADEQNYGQAIILANEFLDRFPGDGLAPRVRVLQGFSHFQLAEYRQAIRCFQNVLDKHVNTDVAERALFLSTLAYYRTGELDRLMTNYNYLASRLLPTPSEWRGRTYYYLGEAYYAQGLYRQAEGMYRLVLTGYPRSNVAAASLQGLVASLSQTGDYELALREQEKFLLALANAESEKGTNSLAVGSIYFNQHKYEDALAQFTDFLEKHPEDPQAASALANQADCYYRLQYYEQAIASWQQVLARFGNAPEAEQSLYRIADTQFGLGQFDQAAASYNRLLERYPAGRHAADARFGVANCAYNRGQDDQAPSWPGIRMTRAAPTPSWASRAATTAAAVTWRST
jgi:TolA-binding protein